MDVSNNKLGTEGGKALAAGLKDNTTITQVRWLTGWIYATHAAMICCVAACYWVTVALI